jgi:hypothetical protein
MCVLFLLLVQVYFLNLIADSKVNLGHTAITTSVVPAYASGVLLAFNTVSLADVNLEWGQPILTW